MYNKEVEVENLNQPRSNKMIDQLVIIENDRPMTTSLIVAERFGKNHRDVMKAIYGINKDFEAEVSTSKSVGSENLAAQRCAARSDSSEDSIESKVQKIAAFYSENFIPDEYTDSRGKKQPMFRMTEEGFLMLAMGFTGLDAAAFRIDFLNAFKALANEVKRLESENKLLLEYKVRQLSDKVRDFEGDHWNQEMDNKVWTLNNELKLKQKELEDEIAKRYALQNKPKTESELYAERMAEYKMSEVYRKAENVRIERDECVDRLERQDADIVRLYKTIDTLNSRLPEYKRMKFHL